MFTIKQGFLIFILDYHTYWGPTLGNGRDSMFVYVETEITDHPQCEDLRSLGVTIDTYISTNNLTSKFWIL